MSQAIKTAVTAPLYDRQGNKISEIELPESLFGIKPHEPALHSYVRMYLNNRRQGTVKTKTRSEVAGGGAKPWRQKGTGRARAGTNSSPLWVGGGRAFGPRPRSHRENLPKKVRRLAMCSALSLRAGGGHVHIIEDVVIDPPKTGEFCKILKNIGLDGDLVLFLTESKDVSVGKSVRNIPAIHHNRACLTNPYEIMRYGNVLFTRAGLDKLVEVFGS
jgi:large subunit ribosomal protein L4